MSVFAVVLLAAAVVLLVAAEWPRVASRIGADAWKARRRARRKSRFRLVETEIDDESDEFARSVERDLAALPTIDPRDVKKR